MAHHKRKRPKHHRSGCLLCKPNKLTAAVKAERRESRRRWLSHERAGGWIPASPERDDQHGQERLQTADGMGPLQKRHLTAEVGELRNAIDVAIYRARAKK